MRKALTVILSFATGFLLCHFARPVARGPEVSLSVAEQGRVFRAPGPLSPGGASPGDAVLRLDVTGRPPAFYPVRPSP